jgi:hypothetical protein
MELEELEEEAIDETYPEVIKTQIHANGQFKVFDVKLKNKNRYHRISQHNYYIQKRFACPYCTNGSTPILDVEMDEILKGLEKQR